ncbi:signal peptidase II [Citricoccus sp. SGAir0253]|uniref:signal peptidase II n=1 Tax=Citricoccus sp. SGAir0253 TaxID=2567881 RepID=UPI0010CD620F|nr:signal peptidase II [Citricoccus sp. SGAir0253]QCU77846.1 signal peptidase II [Citricoccus sp. SGAir0253]
MTDTEPDVPASRDAVAAPRRHRGWIAVLVLAVGYVLDQLTKRWVETTMVEGQVIDVLAPLLRWHFIRNPGAAFSIGEEHTWVFTLIQAGVAVFVAVLLFRVRSTAWALALGGLLGGVLGNLTDRLLRPPGFGVGHVVDFVALPNFAIFNVADSLIVCSMAGIVLLMFTGRRLDGTRESADAPAPRPAEPPAGA